MLASVGSKLLSVLILLVVILGLVGSCLTFHQRTWLHTAVITSTSATFSSTETVTTKPTALYRLFGKVFFDYNGNGRQDQGEPNVPDVTVAVDGANVTVTNAMGWYTLSEIAKGLYRLSLFPPKNFRYMCESADEFRSVTDFYEILLSNDTRKDIGLMEGFLTLPFGKGEGYRITTYVDLDPAVNKVRDWSGGTKAIDSHFGVDYAADMGTPVRAAAPGVVIQAEDGYPDKPRTEDSWFDMKNSGNYVIIDHGNGYMSVYAHLSKIEVIPRELTPDPDNSALQRVKRGEIIGYVGSTGHSTGPHLHLQIQKYTSKGHYIGGGYAIDPYRDLFHRADIAWAACKLCFSNSISLWTRDNDPQPPPESKPILTMASLYVGAVINFQLEHDFVDCSSIEIVRMKSFNQSQDLWRARWELSPR